MLLTDKYKIKDKSDVFFYKNIYKKVLNYIPKEEIYDVIKNMSIEQIKEFQKEFDENKIRKFTEMPNILIHGFHKSSLVNIFLKELFGPSVEDIESVSYKIIGYGNSDVDIDILQSPHHIIIEPNKTGIDKYIIQEVVKEYAKQQSLTFTTSLVNYKIVLINNVDNLSYYAQTSLRYTMERYYNTCKFILCASQPTKIIEPLRSRCATIRMPKPSENELLNYIMKIALKENLTISPSSALYIVNNSNRSINMCLWWLEYYKHNIYDFSLSWKKYLHIIVDLLFYIYNTKKAIKTASIISIRETLNTLLITNITGAQIMMELLTQIINENKITNKLFMLKIVELFHKYDYRLANGTRYIIHIEALIINLCELFYKQVKE